MSELYPELEAAKEAGRNVFRVGGWQGLTPEEMTVWMMGYTISSPNVAHDERICFAWGFLEVYQERRRRERR